MNVESALKDDVFRPLATTIVPGVLAIAPYILIAAVYIPEVEQFWNEHPNAFVTLVAVTVIAAGLICEDFGSEIESECLDKMMMKRDAAFRSRWQSYLTLELDDRLVARKYLRNVLLRFKFELAMIPALISLVIGLTWLNAVHLYLQWQNLVILDGLIVVGIGVLFYEAHQGAVLLDSIRKLILGNKVSASATK